MCGKKESSSSGQFLDECKKEEIFAHDNNMFFSYCTVVDRIVFGPYEAIKVWATKRFDLVETHVRGYSAALGLGLHSETMMEHTIFPAMGRQRHPVLLKRIATTFTLRGCAPATMC